MTVKKDLKPKDREKFNAARLERAAWLLVDRDAVHAGMEEMYRRQCKRGVIV